MANPVISAFGLPFVQPLSWHQIIPFFIGYSDADFDSPVRWEFWDSGTAANGAYFYTPSNAHHPANTTISVSHADFVAGNVWVNAGTEGAETFFVRAFDGTGWSNWFQSTLFTAANAAPVTTANPVAVNVNGWVRANSNFSFSDGNGHAAVRYEFWDSGTAANSAYFYTPGNAHHAADTSIVVAAADLANVWIRGGAVTGAEQMHVRTFDGIAWGNWSQFSLTTHANTAPAMAVANQFLFSNQWAQVRPLLTLVDADAGDTVTQYQFQDLGGGATSGYFYSNNNEHHAANTPFTVNAADVGSVFLRGGSAAGTEQLQVRAFDGTDWGTWTSFNLTTTLNTAPVVTHSTIIMAINGTALDSLALGYSDANGHAATQYEFYDGTSRANSAYFYSSLNAHYAADTSIVVSAADYASVGIRGGSVGGTDAMFVRAFDGLDWSNWRSFSVISINQAPTATIADHFLVFNQWQRVSDWLTYSDPTNTPAVRYEFWDMGTGAASGYFWTPGNEHHAAGAGNSFIVEAANLNGVFVRGGSEAGTETMRVRAFDGELWSAWDDFTLITSPNDPPVALVSDHSLETGAWQRLDTWLTYVDANSHAATMFEFYDGGVGANSGYFYSSQNEHHAAGTTFSISAAQLSSVWLRGGAVPGTETMFVRAFDGFEWSQWDQFTLTTII
jgi:hypothetical protein